MVQGLQVYATIPGCKSNCLRISEAMVIHDEETGFWESV
jgi:hypothetical protein